MDADHGSAALDTAREWLAELAEAIGEPRATQVAAVVCLLAREFADWPGRRSGLTLAKLKRKLAAIERQHAPALAGRGLFMVAQAVDHPRLTRQLDATSLAELLDLPAEAATPEQRWPLISLEGCVGLREGLFNPANLKCVIGTATTIEVIDWTLPDPWALVPDWPRTRPADRRRLALREALRVHDPRAWDKDRAALRRHAATLRSLVLDVRAVRDPADLAALGMPALRELSLSSLSLLASADGAAWFDGLGALRTLQVAVPLSDAGPLLGALRASPRWVALTSLVLHAFELPDEAWRALWDGGPLALEALRACWLSPAQAGAVLRARLPALRVLSLGGSALGEAYLAALLDADLPLLQDLDLRDANVPPQAFLAMAPALRRAFPALRRIGLDYPSDRPVQYHDWAGGPAVASGHERMTREELETGFLAPIGLTLLETTWPRP